MRAQTLRIQVALALAGIIVVAVPTLAQQQKPETFGKAPQVQQSIPPKVGAQQQPLKLTDEQRAQIAQALRTVHNAVPVEGDKNKVAREFEPKIGDKVPTDVKGATLPSAILTAIPELKQYEYAELKDKILIVDPLTGKVVDMFPRG